MTIMRLPPVIFYRIFSIILPMISSYLQAPDTLMLDLIVDLSETVLYFVRPVAAAQRRCRRII